MFRRPTELPLVKADLAPGLEFFADASVVIPPSAHASGVLYDYLPGRAPGDVDVAGLPPAWSDHLCRVAEPGHRAPRGSSGGRPPNGGGLDTVFGRAFESRGWLNGEERSNGAQPVLCPWAASHRGPQPTGDTSSAVLPTTVGTMGVFRCLHASCRAAPRTTRHIMEALGAMALKEGRIRLAQDQAQGRRDRSLVHSDLRRERQQARSTSELLAVLRRQLCRAEGAAAEPTLRAAVWALAGRGVQDELVREFVVRNVTGHVVLDRIDLEREIRVASARRRGEQ